MEEQTHKPHHETKKKEKNIDIHNIKAFGYNKGQRARTAIAHQLNIEQIRLFQPNTRKTTLEDPPIVIAVQGPPGCGKSLLIKCLVRHYSRQRLVDLKGPITVVTSKTQRITFIEVANNINAMIDASKVADLVLLVVNGEKGFEMETFEYLNLLLSHGFPKVIGILTHLDNCDKVVSRNLKARFRKELNTSVKVYKLERLINGKYEKKSIVALSRLLNLAKIRVLSFREKRGYCLVDRAELTNENKSIALYGYTRGIGLKEGDNIHIAGAGDFVINRVSELDDPCPLISQKASNRSLQVAQRHIHAPFSTVGGVIIDDNAAYVDLPKNNVNFTIPNSENLDIAPEEAAELEEQIEVTPGVEMVRQLQKKSALKQKEEKVQLFPGMELEEEEEEDDDEIDEKLLENQDEEEEAPMKNETKNSSSDFEEEENNEAEAEPIEIEEGRIGPGKYVRMEFDGIPKAFIEKLNPDHPIIVGMLFDTETEIKQQWVKIKRHRFYDRKLKSNDPLVVSVGWRRYQTIPIYFNEERGGKLRFMKYIPDLLTCYVTFFGPISAVNVGVTAFQHIKEQLIAFRVSATGVTIAPMGDQKIVKKLRVVGHPKEIYKRTAMIDDMFTSDVEASQFIGAAIKTVSGIRGQIKHAEKNGIVRCSFEDTIKNSDIVFLNGWVTITPTQFFAPINDLITDDIAIVRTTAEIRADLGLRPQYKEDSVYKEVERPEFVEKALKIPKNLKEKLPYELKAKFKPTETQKAVIANEQESKMLSLFEKTKHLFEMQQKEKQREKQQMDAIKEKARKEEEQLLLHKRTKRKQEYFQKHPKKGPK